MLISQFLTGNYVILREKTTCFKALQVVSMTSKLTSVAIKPYHALFATRFTRRVSGVVDMKILQYQAHERI